MVDFVEGIPIPPEKIKETIDKTAGYVLKNGETFEDRLKNSAENDQFAFLKDDNEYNPYYKWKLSGGEDQKKAEMESTSVEERPVAEIPKPIDLEFLTELPPISALDLDIIKLTALFSAKNSGYGPALLRYQTGKGNKHQFEFLKEAHSFHPLYKNLVKQYQKLIQLYESPELLGDLMTRLKESDKLFDNAYARAQYKKQHKDRIKDANNQKQERQIQFASIDWQDFRIVGKVYFDAIDEVTELSTPLSREDLIYRSSQAKNKEMELQKVKPVIKKPKEVTPKSKDISSEEVTSKGATPKEATPVPKGMKIKAAGESRLKNRKTNVSNKMIRCPLTNELVPEDEFDNHLRTKLRDPRYEEQQNNFIKKNFLHESNLTNDQVYENIKRLAKKRTGEEVETDKRQHIT